MNKYTMRVLCRLCPRSSGDTTSIPVVLVLLLSHRLIESHAAWIVREIRGSAIWDLLKWIASNVIVWIASTWALLIKAYPTPRYVASPWHRSCHHVSINL